MEPHRLGRSTLRCTPSHNSCTHTFQLVRFATPLLKSDHPSSVCTAAHSNTDRQIELRPSTIYSYTTTALSHRSRPSAFLLAHREYHTTVKAGGLWRPASPPTNKKQRNTYPQHRPRMFTKCFHRVRAPFSTIKCIIHIYIYIYYGYIWSNLTPRGDKGTRAITKLDPLVSPTVHHYSSNA